ncbi:MAG: 2OG-Fe(II) oxygenase, partial [Shewanella sp.]
RGIEQQLNADIRRDRIRWLEAQNPQDALYLDVMAQLKAGLNRRLFMGLFDYESHYAVYQPGAFYKKHVDALKGSQNRILTTVFFLNPDWQAADGGELIIYDEADNELERIAPKMGQFVIFLSERFPHEVMPTLAERRSIAGWFRVSNSMHGF